MALPYSASRAHSAISLALCLHRSFKGKGLSTFKLESSDFPESPRYHALPLCLVFLWITTDNRQQQPEQATKQEARGGRVLFVPGGGIGNTQSPPPPRRPRKTQVAGGSRTTTEEGGGDVAAAWLLGGMAGGCGCGRSTTRVARALSPPTAPMKFSPKEMKVILISPAIRHHWHILPA